MSRLRKEVLASRVGNGEDAAALVAPAKQRGPRGLAMKEGRRMKVPMGVRSETRSLEAETHDLERQLDNLRVQMAMEKERQQTLVSANGGIWRSAQRGVKAGASKGGTRKLASRGGKRKKAAAAAAAAAPSPSPEGAFLAAETFSGERAGFVFRTGPHGTGYYRDGAAGAPAERSAASPPKPPDGDRAPGKTGSPAMRSRTMRSSVSPPQVPLPKEGGEETERIGEQEFSLMGTFADNYDSDLLRDEPAPAPAVGQDVDAQRSGDDAGISGGAGLAEGQFDEDASRASFLDALSSWRQEGSGAEVWSAEGEASSTSQEAGQEPRQEPRQEPGRCATPIECQTESSRPLAQARPSTAGASRKVATRKSYFEELVASKSGGGLPLSPTAEARRDELQKLRAAKARHAEELAELRRHNAELKQKMSADSSQPEQDQKRAPQEPPAVAAPAASPDRPATPAERDAAKTVARQFTDMLFRPSSAPSSRSPATVR